MILKQLLERLEYEVVQGSDKIEITTLINDSRKVEEGSVFVCISGAVSDGHQYVADVAKKRSKSRDRAAGCRGTGGNDSDPCRRHKVRTRTCFCRLFRLSGREAAHYWNYRDKGKDDHNLYDQIHSGGSRT